VGERTNAPRTRSRTRVCKNQKISLHFSRASPTPPPRSGKRNGKEIFWFCFAVSVSEKSTIILSLLFALFSALTATEAPCYPRLVVVLNSIASFTVRGNSRIWIVLSTNKSVCACPTRPVRTHHPHRFRKNYKTAGMAPLRIAFNFLSNNIATTF